MTLAVDRAVKPQHKQTKELKHMTLAVDRAVKPQHKQTKELKHCWILFLICESFVNLVTKELG